MLAVEINFLRRVYVASTARDEPETVVQPTRVFAGLVQACHANDMFHHRHVLERIEDAGPPEIHMGDTFTNPRTNSENQSRYFVPTRANTKGLGKPGSNSTPWGESKDEMRRPVTRLAEPRCVMVWPDLLLTEEETEAVDALLGEVTHVGRVESTAALGRVEDPNYSGLVQQFMPDPSEGGIPIRVPRPGVLQALENAYDNGEHLDHWPMVTYRRQGSREGVPTIWNEMIRLRLLGPPVHATRALRLIEALRSKLISLEHEQCPIPPVFTGHGWERGASHAAVVPLVFTGGEHANGMIKGLGICLPHNTTKGEKTQIMAALLEVCTQGFYLDNQDFQLRLLDNHERTILTLRNSQWCRPSRTWATVTPVVLDVPPKKNRPVSLLVARACAYVGLPEPLRMEWRQTGFQGGVIPQARKFGVSRKGQKPMDRQVGHLCLEFDQPVRGPLALGQLRHFGMGMMLPEDDHA